ncbi:transposase [Dokdonella immobilis]|uniref:transposase n=1 Tax=Dokdonella immobilis TaxID=578942 RepID=UPI001113B78B|nr:transposase [Dokdonella immobilis]
MQIAARRREASLGQSGTPTIPTEGGGQGWSLRSGRRRSHVVLRIDPDAANPWTDEEVGQRWVRLFPATVDGDIDTAACEVKKHNLPCNADRIKICRQRLGSLAWFMRSLNEPIARRANREDACTGRFWEGRYMCQALLDDAAVLTCMSYVDLNPIQAGVAENLQTSVHTSALQRIAAIENDACAASRPLSGIQSIPSSTGLPLSVADCLEVIDWTARVTRGGKGSPISATAPSVLRKH